VYEPTFKQAGIGIVSEFSHRYEVHCYGSELRQVFANLIGNAFDATGSGGALRLSTERELHDLLIVRLYIPDIEIIVVSRRTQRLAELAARTI
jgi:signal transduction histidine kinase